MKFSLSNTPMPPWLEPVKVRAKELWVQLQAKEPKKISLVKELNLKELNLKELLDPARTKERLKRVRRLFVKKRPEGLAGLISRPDGVGLVHLTFNPETEQRPRLNTCVFQEINKGQSPGRAAGTLVKANKLELARFVGVLDRNAYTVFPAEVPDVPREEWAKTMKFRIKDQIDFPVNQAVLEVFDMPGPYPGKDSGRIYVAAARDGEVRRHIQMFQEPNLDLQFIDILELALRNLTTALEDDREGLAMLYLEAKHGLIMILKNGNFYLARRIEIGLDAILNTMGEESFGKSYGFNNSPLLDNIALEAQRTMDYFESHFSQAPVVALHIAPMITPIPGLRQAMATKLGMRIKQLPMNEIIDIADGITELDIARCLPVIGAALRGSALPT